MLEMVLPNSDHVRFGPTEWESAEGYAVPKTISVSGECNSNPKGAEEDWIWEECEAGEGWTWEDLWSVRCYRS